MRKFWAVATIALGVAAVVVLVLALGVAITAIFPVSWTPP